MTWKEFKELVNSFDAPDDMPVCTWDSDYSEVDVERIHFEDAELEEGSTEQVVLIDWYEASE